MGLVGRERECRTLDRLLATVRAGTSGALVIRGEAGIGKSALLHHARALASGCRVVSAAGVQADAELPFAALHQLCAPLLHRLERLPPPQRDALGTAFGLWPGSPPDRFFVGLAVLSLLAGVAEQQPLGCLVDDAQWLDQTSTRVLALVARRLASDRVALLFAVRGDGVPDLADLPEVALAGLPDPDARA